MNPIKKLKIYALSTLLHHANRESKSENFYKIKRDLLTKYGTFLQYDVQYLEGKKCFTCGGTGVFHGYNWSGYAFSDSCNNCGGTGWYKDPVWNILEKVKFGKHTFHTPWKRSYTKPDLQATPIINGYIEHNYTKYGKLCLDLLYIIFDRKRWWKQDAGFGWRTCWWRPVNWLHNSAHLIKEGRKSIPVNNLKKKIQNLLHKFGKQQPHTKLISTDDLPF